MKHIVRSILILWAMGGLAVANEGQVLYETYCGACHAPDGKGANEGQFPPLAGSSWVKGSHARLIQVILHGLQGEVVVPNAEGVETTYNLVMPPQGAALTDEQIASIATYVRSAWGHQETGVSRDMVQKERKASAARKEMWTAEELQKLYPLPVKASRYQVQNLIAHVYEGKFRNLEELREAEVASVEEEQGGVISLRHAGDREDAYGIIWEGDLEAPRTGEYIFELDSDDGSAVFVDEAKVVDVRGLGPLGRARKGKVLLEKGTHRIRVEYFEHAGNQGISLAWRGPGLKETLLSETKKKKKTRVFPSIPLTPPSGKAMMYRNFIEGTTARGIGVGYDGGMNLAFSADTMAVEVLWSGKFLDGGRHWTDRGQGRTRPRGEDLRLSKGPALAILSSPQDPWPQMYSENLQPRFRGYTLNAKRQPTFLYTLGRLKMSDTPLPIFKGQEATPGLARRVKIEVEGDPPQNLYFRASQGYALTQTGSGSFRIGERLFLQVAAGEVVGDPIIRGQELLVPLQLKSGPNEFVLNYLLN